MKTRWITMLTLSLFNWGPVAGQLKVGDKLPDFQLQDQNRQTFHLKNELGKGPLVIYFYPKDETPGCTKEACSFRDSFTSFQDLGAKVIGISSDDIASHKKFAEKYRLPFTLLADEGGKVRKLFGVPKSLGMTGRVTYVIDNEGKIIHLFNSQLQATKHVTEALQAIKKS
ncbi:peroxiredoxin [Chitinophaga horti]|uniref:thioredoxin-dependent peroxiredoxin n=1 Tax=Chitinophaga horti TaxID=2920382 RepID=A0ABY6J639_9BACT|nr:peroxiredoxin [Chitinophaga horti]UYQ95083.1 peroxiredoxin [Chitinophaga horti]